MKDDMANSAFAGSVIDDSDLDIDEALAKIGNGTKSTISKSNRPSRLNVDNPDEDYDEDYALDPRAGPEFRCLNCGSNNPEDKRS